MSRVGKMPIAIPKGVSVAVEGRRVVVKGPKGELALTCSPLVGVAVEGDQVLVTRKGDSKAEKTFHGTTRSLIANMVEGVEKGFKKELEIAGVGFRAQLDGRKLTMTLGYSHPIEFTVPENVTVTVPDATTMVVEGCDKQAVGQVGARLRAFYPAEPYKGKGVKYKGEQIRRKAGKTVA